MSPVTAGTAARVAARRSREDRVTPAHTARWIAVAAFLLYAATGGGRIAGSDEVTMFQLARALSRGEVAVPEGATLQGRHGRAYSKNAAAQAIAALPLVAVGDAAARGAGLPPARRELAARFVASFFNALVTAILLGVFHAAARALGAGSGAAFAATLMLGFATPLWVYSKSFMAEPLQALGLLLALTGSARAAAGERRGTKLAALGVLLAVSAKLVMLPLAVLVLWPLAGRRSDGTPVPGRAWVLGALLAALAGHLVYNFARFGTPLETGYGRQAGASAWSTPLWVGLYGLLLSSGKGVVWFAPAVLLVARGVARMRHLAGGERSGVAIAARRASAAILATCGFAVVLYSRFEHWAGDGSFGPRYLVPVLPLAMLAVAFALTGVSRAVKRVAWGLGALGLLVQVGGVFIYFGAQMREAGDYPYSLSLSDPRFMESSHFNPRYSPILGHWSMLHRNAIEHLHGDAPRLGQDSEVDPRLGISAGEQQALLQGLDVWWLYAQYAGLPAAPIWIALFVLLALSAWAWSRAWRSSRAESSA